MVGILLPCTDARVCAFLLQIRLVRKPVVKQTLQQQQKGKREAEFLFRFATEEKECKTIAIVDTFFAR